MSPSEFLQLHLQDQIPMSPSHRINVNIDTEIPAGQGLEFAGRGVQALQDYYVLNVSVNTQGLVDGINEILYTVLADVKKIRFNMGGYYYDLEVTNGVSYINFGTQFFMYTVNPFLIPGDIAQNIVSGDVIEDVLIDFSPFIGDLKDRLRDYQALLNNTQKSRSSYKIRQSKRVVSGTRPSNFLPIYSGSAERANVQDSLYYDTGWKNARYDGTLSSSENYGGVIPSTTVRSSEAYATPDVTDDTNICSLTESEKVYTEFFFSGKDIIPGFYSGSTGLVLAEPVSIGDPSATPPIPPQKVFNISGSIQNGTLDKGDILILRPTAVQEEFVKIEKITPILSNFGVFNQPQQGGYQLQVSRAVKGTYARQHQATAPIEKVNRIDVFEYLDNESNLRLSENRKVLIRDTQEILHTDEFGTMFSSSFC